MRLLLLHRLLHGLSLVGHLLCSLGNLVPVAAQEHHQPTSCAVRRTKVMVANRGETQVKEQKAKVVVVAHGISSLPHRLLAGIAAHGIVMIGSREIGARVVGGEAMNRQ